jgi:hypothetical protein
MSVPVISSAWLIWAIFAGGAVVVVLLTVAIAFLTKDSNRKPRRGVQAPPTSPAAEVPANEHALV